MYQICSLNYFNSTITQPNNLKEINESDKYIAVDDHGADDVVIYLEFGGTVFAANDELGLVYFVR